MKFLSARDDWLRGGAGERSRAPDDGLAADRGFELPYEPPSRAGLLSASHVFVVEVVGIMPADLAPTASAPGAVEMALRHVSSLKGRLDVRPGDVFLSSPRSADPVPGRDDGLVPHVQPWIGGRYVVVARGPGTARTLVGPRGCRAILPLSHVADVTAAAEAQAAFAQATCDATAVDADLEACRALVRFAATRCRALHGPFGAYLFARLAPPLLRAYRESPRPPATGPLVAAVFGLLAEPGLTWELRAQVLREATLLAANASNKSLSRDIGRALLHELIAGRGEPARLVHECVYPVLFDVRGRPRLQSWEVVTDPERRTRASHALARVGGERALKIAAWLSPLAGKASK
jgi:hypothetical protein